MEQKIFTAPLELKADGQPGEFKAVFASLNVTDLHGDITIPGAFTDGQEAVVEPWNHGYTLPAGKGIIRSNDIEAWVEGQFFLDTEVGRDNYITVKNLGPLAQWSYTFDVIQAAPADPAKNNGADRFLQKLDVVGFSAVTRGAGINTRTLTVKTAVSNEDEAAHGGKSSVEAINTQINLAEIGLIMTNIGVSK